MDSIIITCPISLCRTENEFENDRCRKCGTPLKNYARLYYYPDQLYNQALLAAREGKLRLARDLLSAVVQWCPYDVQARNGLAMACFSLGDLESAQYHWSMVLQRRNTDEIAVRGLQAIADKQITKPKASGKKKHRKPRHRGR